MRLIFRIFGSELRNFGIHVSLVESAFTRTSLEENGAQPNRMLSVYDKGRAAMNQTWKNGIAKGDPVEAAATEVIKAATDGVLSLPCLEVPNNNDNNVMTNSPIPIQQTQSMPP